MMVNGYIYIYIYIIPHWLTFPVLNAFNAGTLAVSSQHVVFVFCGVVEFRGARLQAPGKDTPETTKQHQTMSLSEHVQHVLLFGNSCSSPSEDLSGLTDSRGFRAQRSQRSFPSELERSDPFQRLFSDERLLGFPSNNNDALMFGCEIHCLP